MSEIRIYDISITRKIARVQGKLKGKIESTLFRAYNAGQFKTRLDGANFSRQVPARKSERNDFYLTMFRVSIDKKWYEPSGRRYQFFTEDEFYEIVKTWGKVNI